MKKCGCTDTSWCAACYALAQKAGILDKPKMSERALQSAIMRLAKDNGWLAYHTWNARKSAPGYFDCTFAKVGHPLVLAELKTATGSLTIEQQRWYDITKQTTGVECYIWRPDDWDLVEKLLRS